MSTSRFVTLLILLVVFSPIVSASPENHHFNTRHKENMHHSAGYARVIFVKPVYKTVRVSRPQVKCVNHSPYQSGGTVIHYGSPEQAVMGGLIGGIVGHQLGNNRNRAFTTMAGVVIGSTIANNMTGASYSVSQYRRDSHQHCRQQTLIIEQQKIVGYKVKYRYRGKIYVTKTRHHPGDRFPIHAGLQHHRHDM